MDKWREPVRTDMYCHQCTKNFIALVDESVDGCHVIECPWCGHEHCRTIKNGQVTGDRWDGRAQRIGVAVEKRRVWKADSLPATTSSAGAFLRERWLERVDIAP